MTLQEVEALLATNPTNKKYQDLLAIASNVARAQRAVEQEERHVIEARARFEDAAVHHQHTELRLKIARENLVAEETLQQMMEMMIAF